MVHRPGWGRPACRFPTKVQTAKTPSASLCLRLYPFGPMIDRIAPSLPQRRMSPRGPSVWTGRALQVENDDLEKLVLRFCIRPIDGAFELLAIMDIRARSISFATRPRRPEGPPDHERAGETFSPSPLSDSQTSAGKPTLAFGISLSRQASPW